MKKLLYFFCFDVIIMLRKHIEKMLLYHGSNVIIDTPRLNYSRKSLDFGAGFYATSDYNQAEKWALRTAHLRKIGNRIKTSVATKIKRPMGFQNRKCL